MVAAGGCQSSGGPHRERFGQRQRKADTGQSEAALPHGLGLREHAKQARRAARECRQAGAAGAVAGEEDEVVVVGHESQTVEDRWGRKNLSKNI